MEWTRGDFRISDDPAELDLDAIDALLRTTYWAADRPRELTEQAIRGSFCLGLYHGRVQLGFARAITDFATFAWFSDVIVHPDHRGRGLGKWLVQVLVDHPRLQVRSQYLTTEDAHSLYERHGFFRYETLKRHPVDWARPSPEAAAFPARVLPVSRPELPRDGTDRRDGREWAEGDGLAGGSDPGAGLGNALILDGVEHVAVVKSLFREYAEGLGFSLCFQSFDEELATLPGRYGPPRGRLLLLEVNGEPVGCAGLRPLEESSAEMKRLYVRPGFRGRGWGRLLAETLIVEARGLGYRRIVLDTLETMTAARALYQALGFHEIPPWMPHPVPGSICLEKLLA